MGRIGRLIERRNDKLVERFYYWTEVQRLRFDDAIRQLSENEFFLFLSENMIVNILRSHRPKGSVFKPPRCPELTEEQLELFREDGK